MDDTKSTQKNELPDMKVILFILYAAGVRWSAFFNTIWFLEN
jgi:hypothetical protein